MALRWIQTGLTTTSASPRGCRTPHATPSSRIDNPHTCSSGTHEQGRGISRPLPPGAAQPKLIRSPCRPTPQRARPVWEYSQCPRSPRYVPDSSGYNRPLRTVQWRIYTQPGYAKSRGKFGGAKFPRKNPLSGIALPAACTHPPNGQPFPQSSRAQGGTPQAFLRALHA